MFETPRKYMGMMKNAFNILGDKSERKRLFLTLGGRGIRVR
jgi:hypothetical protein